MQIGSEFDCILISIIKRNREAHLFILRSQMIVCDSKARIKSHYSSNLHKALQDLI